MLGFGKDICRQRVLETSATYLSRSFANSNKAYQENWLHPPQCLIDRMALLGERSVTQTGHTQR